MLAATKADRWLRIGCRSLHDEGLGFLTLWPRVHRSVPGWLTATDARLLYALAHHGPRRGAVVEIGAAWGRSTVALAAGAKHARRERVYSIDPHTGDPWWLEGIGGTPGVQGVVDGNETFSSFASFSRTLHRFSVDDYVIPVVTTSNEAAETVDTGPIRLLFVDGLHTYAGVRDDIDHWVPRVVRGGIIVFDDYYTQNDGVGVKPAVDELLCSGLVEPTLHRTDGVHVWVRRA